MAEKILRNNSANLFAREYNFYLFVCVYRLGSFVSASAGGSMTMTPLEFLT